MTLEAVVGPTLDRIYLLCLWTGAELTLSIRGPAITKVITFSKPTDVSSDYSKSPLNKCLSIRLMFVISFSILLVL